MKRSSNDIKRKKAPHHLASPCKFQKSIEEDDVVDGLPPGIGFTPETIGSRALGGPLARKACCRPLFSRTEFSLTYPLYTKPMEKSRRASISNDNDLDNDGIKLASQSTKHLAEPPQDVPDSFTSISKSPAAKQGLFFKTRKEPDMKTDILITHGQQTDSPLGDYFGCKLSTYHEPKTNYYQHLLQNVTPNGVADQLKLCNNDELVLLNNDFVPQLTHADVLNRFHRLPVDSHTRLSLVFRRPKGKDLYQWYLTSAILCPFDPKTTETIKEEKFDKLRNNEFTKESKVRLRCEVPNLYLDINDTCISVGPLRGDHMVDRSKTICQRTKFYEENGQPTWMSSLKGTVGRGSYIAVSTINELQPEIHPVWYSIQMIGAKISFRYKDKDVYLGYSSLEQKAIAKKEEQYFVIFPYTDSHGYDELDSRIPSQKSLETPSSQEELSSHGRPHLMRTRSQTRRQVSFTTQLDSLCI